MIGRIEFDVGVSDLICTRLGAELGSRGGDCSQTAPQDSQKSRVRGKQNNNVKLMDDGWYYALSVLSLLLELDAKTS